MESGKMLTAWYTAGSDNSHYASALEACRNSRIRLKSMGLAPEENELLSVPPSDGQEVKARAHLVLIEVQKREKRPDWFDKTRQFFHNFCKVVDKTSALVQPMLPQSAEYTITFGLLVLLFRAVVTKNDREEALMEHLDKLAAKLPVIDFYNTTFPTPEIKFTVAKVYAEVMSFLDNALSYYHGGRLAKLADALLRTKPKFEESITIVEKEVNKMLDLKNVAHEAQTADIQVIVTKMEQDVATLLRDSAQKAQADEIQEILSRTGKGRQIGAPAILLWSGRADTCMILQDLIRLQDSMHYIGAAASFGLETLHTRMVSCASTITDMQSYSIITHGLGLQDAIIASDPASYWDAGEAVARLSARGFRLSQKDHWENNGILNELLDWSNAPSSILWIGGSSGHQDSWVTEMSLDIAQVLRSHRVNIVYVFCSDFLDTSRPLTPTRLVRMLIFQFLEMNPKVSYENAGYFSPIRIRNTMTFSGVWQIFERLVMSTAEVFILIDKVEACIVDDTADDTADLRNDLLPSMLELVKKAASVGGIVRGIITSVYEAPQYDGMRRVYIDTARRSAVTNS